MVTLINVLVGLRLQNIALIDSLELPFEKGFTVFTGETGAGKSIFLDAIDLLLGGGKHSSTPHSIKFGSKIAFIEGCFLKTKAIENWFEENLFDIDTNEFYLTRDWKLKEERWSSRIRLNGSIINKQQILSLRHHLIDFTVQGQIHNNYLLNNQCQWIDKFGSNSIAKLLNQVRLRWQNWHKVNIQLEKMKLESLKDKNQLEEINQFLKDVDFANIENPLEDIDLQNEQDRLVHGVKLQEGLAKVFSYLNQGLEDVPTAIDNISKTIQELKTLSILDGSLSDQLEQAIEIYSDLEKLSNSLDNYFLNLDSNPHRLNEVQERILLLKRLQNRYNMNLKELLLKRDEYIEFTTSLDKTMQLNDLKEQEEKLRIERDRTNLALTKLRLSTAREFENILMKHLRSLGLSNVQFKVQINSTQPSIEGSDDVSFLFSANPDQPLAPLAQIASGGEMSRFLLAMKTVLADVVGSTTLIFDEIDSGVSGKISSAIAKLLKELSASKQVFCVTHQPLVAAMADHHFSVSKSVQNGVSRSIVTSLQDFDSRKMELAELAGGDFEEATNYAASLLSNKAA